MSPGGAGADEAASVAYDTVEYEHEYTVSVDETERFLQFLANAWRTVGDGATVDDTLHVERPAPGAPDHPAGHLVSETPRERTVPVWSRRAALAGAAVAGVAGVALGVAGALRGSLPLSAGGVVAAAGAVAGWRHGRPVSETVVYDRRIEVAVGVAGGGGTERDGGDVERDGGNTERDGAATGESAGVESTAASTDGGAVAGVDERTTASEESGARGAAGGTRPSSRTRERTLVVETVVETPFPSAMRATLDETVATVDERVRESLG